MEKFAACLAELEDPPNVRHDLLEILVIGFAPRYAAERTAPTWPSSTAKAVFLRQFLQLRHGIPSYDTFSRVFRLLDPAQFQACFLRFV